MSASARAAGGACRAGASLLIVCALASLLYGAARAADLSESSPDPPLGDSIERCPAGLDPHAPLSLARAVDLALCNNAEVRDGWANIRMQAAAVGVARAAYWPTLSATASELNERTGYPGSSLPATETTGKTIYGSFDWRLFDFGGRSARYHVAKSLLEAAVASRDATIQRVLGTVVQAYFDAITAKAVADDKTQTESIAQETLASAQRRAEQGGAAQNDVLQATAALGRAILDENRATAAYEKSLAVLVYCLGIPAGSAIELAADVDSRTGTEQKDLTTWLKETEQRHPAIVAARAAVDAARDQVASDRSAGWPTVDVTANYYQNGFPYEGLTASNTRVATVGVTVTVPLFDGFATRYSVQEAEATVKVREAQLEDTRQATLRGVVEAYADAQSSVRNLSVSDGLLQAAQAAFESSQRRYTQGAADIVELLNAQAMLADARAERLRSLAEWRSARLNLLASAGVLDRQELGGRE